MFCINSSSDSVYDIATILLNFFLECCICYRQTLYLLASQFQFLVRCIRCIQNVWIYLGDVQLCTAGNDYGEKWHVVTSQVAQIFSRLELSPLLPAVSMEMNLFSEGVSWSPVQVSRRCRGVCVSFQLWKWMLCVRFEVFTSATLKNAGFWDVTLCGSCKNRRFGGTYRLHHPGEKNRRARNNVRSN
jgi:hypothetical protein